MGKDIFIDIEKDKFIISDPKDLIRNDARALLYIKDTLHCELNNQKYIISVETEEYEQTLQKILRVMQKYGFQCISSQEVKTVLSGYFQEENKFREFSKQANDIRNDKLDSTYKKEFKEFAAIIKILLPNRRLFPLQLLSSFHMTFAQNSCNFSIPGAGKTSIVYAAFAYLNQLPKNDPKYIEKLLVVGPLSSFGPWELEYKECFGKFPLSKRLTGEIKKSARKLYFYSSNPADLTLISYNGIANILDEVIFFLKRIPVMVVLDEAHRIKNIEGGIFANSVLNISKYCKSRIVLTGSPAPNGYEDLINLFKFIWPNKDLISFYPYQLMQMSENLKDSRTNQLIRQISPFFIRIKKSDLHLPIPINHDPIFIKMSQIQSEIYNFIENDYMEYFGNNRNDESLLSNLTKAKLIRLMQASTNPALLQKPIKESLFDEEIPQENFIDDSLIINKILNYQKNDIPPKFIAAEQLIRKLINNNEKVVVWMIFIQNILEFSEYLNKKKILNKIIYGATPIEKDDQINDVETRESIISEFNNTSSKLRVLLANPFAVSESISLHKACHNAIYIERSFNAAHFIQSKERIHRYGLNPNDQINYFYLLSDNAIDRTIHERLDFKEKRMLKIIESEEIPLFNRILNNKEEIDDIKSLILKYETGS